MEFGHYVILTLKVAVVAVTLLLVASLVALARGNYRLHGRINLAFFALTLSALVGLEVLVQLVRPDVFQFIKENEPLRRALLVHLCFSVPSAVLLPVMFFTGWTRRGKVHFALSFLFVILWTGTFVTGVFFLPHAP